MRVLKRVPGLLVAFVMSAGMAWAEDIALIYGDIGQVAPFRDSTGITSTDFAAPLRRVGFRIVQPKNRSSGHMRLAAQGVEALIASDQVDRLVIVVMGPLAGSTYDSWVMSNGAGATTPLDVGVSSVSLNALSSMAERAGGRAVVMIAPGTEVDTLGEGLTPGLGQFNRAENVTYVTGPADQLVEVLLDGLLDPGLTFADAAREAPRDVRFDGFVSRHVGLLGQPTGVATPEAVEQGYWLAMAAIDTQEGYELYLEAYPDGGYRSAALDRINLLKFEPERLAREAEDALNLKREDRRTIQRNLSLLGFNPRGIDGLFGAGSRSAISAWQRINGFEETGFVTGNQLLRLRDQAQIRADELEEADRLRQIEQERLDRSYWRNTGRNGDEAGLRAYLERYPDGQFADIARARLEVIENARRSETEREERAAWDAAVAANSIAGYRSFLSTYPDSGFSDAAQSRLRELEDAQQAAGAIAQAKAEEKNIAGTKVARLLIEQRLAQLRAGPGAVDGKFTKETRQAIRRFQRHRQLPVTGFVSRETMVRLMAGRR